jgi:hypothetical protein
MAVRTSSALTDRPLAAVVRVVVLVSPLLLAAQDCEGLSSCSGDEPGNEWMISSRAAAGLGGSSEPRIRDGLDVIEGPSMSWRPEIPAAAWKYVVVHHSGTPTGSVESIHADHSRRRDVSGRPWLGIGYHFVVGNGQGMKDGGIESTFRWRDQIHGAHSGSELFNAYGIGICLIGDFQRQRPTHAQWSAVCRLVESLLRDFELPVESIVGHSSVAATACPGRFLSVQKLRDALTQPIRNPG